MSIKHLQNLHIILGGFFISTLLTSCYSFNGGSIDYSTIKTINIPNFPNLSSQQLPSLEQDFTTSLQNKFAQRTKLIESKENPDLNLEGEITNYQITPVNIQSDTNKNDLNRLSITIKVRFENKKVPEKSFERSFTDYEDVNSNGLLDLNAQTALSKKVTDRIIEQIFNAVTSDW